MIGKSAAGKGNSSGFSYQPQLLTAAGRLEVGSAKGGGVPDASLWPQPRPLDAAQDVTAEVKQRGRLAASDTSRTHGSRRCFTSFQSQSRHDVSVWSKSSRWWSQGVSTSRPRRFVLEVFSGCAGLSKAMAEHVFYSVAYDKTYGASCDLLDPAVFRRLMSFITKHSHELALVWFGTPCDSWSPHRCEMMAQVYLGFRIFTL